MTDESFRTLTEELRARADDVAPAPHLAAAARGRAQHLRTRRRVVVSAVAAVALIVAAPGVLSVTTDDAGPPPADRPSPTRLEPTPSPDPQGTTTLTLDEMEQAAAPDIGWTENATFHTSHGRDVTFPESVQHPASSGDGGAGQLLADEPAVVFSEGGSVPGYGPAVSADGNLLARTYYEDTVSGLVVTPAEEPASGGASLHEEIPAGQRIEPVGFLGDDDLVSNVYDDGMPSGARRDRFDGEPTTPWDVDTVGAVSEAAQLVAGRTSASDDGSCWAVLPADGGRPLWETCDYSLDHFNPDGGLLLAGPAYRSGAGDTVIGVLDARTGDVVHEFETPRDGFVVDTAFESETEILAVVAEGNESAIVRCDVGGDCERATRIADTDGVGSPFGLARQP